MFTDLYFIKNTRFDDGKLTASVTLNAKHSIFEGHFPGQPVLPGVCQLGLVKELLQQHFGKALKMSKADQVKFMAMVDPRKTPDLEIQIQISEVDEIITAQTVISFEEIVFLKSKARFANA